MADFTFPNFTSSGLPAGAFPYANLPQQLFSTFNALPTASYGRWNGTGVSQDLGYPTGINPGPANGYPQAGLLNAPANPVPTNPAAPSNPATPPNKAGLLGGFDNYAANFGAMPTIPNAAPDNTPYAVPQPQTGMRAGIARLAALYPESGFAQFANQPKSYTPAQFNQVAAVNPRLALTMLGQGGGAFQEAVAAANHWTPQQKNSWINGTFYGPGDPHSGGLNAENLALLRSMGIG